MGFKGKSIIEQSVSAKITKADGTVIDLGVIAYKGRNPFKKIYVWFKGVTRIWQHLLRM